MSESGSLFFPQPFVLDALESAPNHLANYLLVPPRASILRIT